MAQKFKSIINKNKNEYDLMVKKFQAATYELNSKNQQELSKSNFKKIQSYPKIY